MSEKIVNTERRSARQINDKKVGQGHHAADSARAVPTDRKFSDIPRSIIVSSENGFNNKNKWNKMKRVIVYFYCKARNFFHWFAVCKNPNLFNQKNGIKFALVNN